MKDNNILTVRHQMTDWEMRHHHMPSMDAYLKTEVATLMGKAVAEKVQVKHSFSEGYHEYSAQMAVLPAIDYRIMQNELKRLQIENDRLQHLLKMANQEVSESRYREEYSRNSNIDGWYRQGL